MKKKRGADGKPMQIMNAGSQSSVQNKMTDWISLTVNLYKLFLKTLKPVFPTTLYVILVYFCYRLLYQSHLVYLLPFDNLLQQHGLILSFNQGEEALNAVEVRAVWNIKYRGDL